MAFFWTLKCTFGVSGFRGSVAGRGDCNISLKVQTQEHRDERRHKRPILVNLDQVLLPDMSVTIVTYFDYLFSKEAT